MVFLTICEFKSRLGYKITLSQKEEEEGERRKKEKEEGDKDEKEFKRLRSVEARKYAYFHFDQRSKN